MPRPVALIAAAAVVLVLVLAVGLARGAVGSCNVGVAGGFVNCLNYSNPSLEGAKSFHVVGRPYRFQIYRTSDGAVWGPWTWNDGNYHFVFLGLSGSFQGQIDNQGSGTGGYEVTLQ